MATKRFSVSYLETHWIKVGEVEPPIGMRLLVATEKCGVMIGCFSKSKGILHSQSQFPMKAVTHWRLMPRTPNHNNPDEGVLDLQII
jgi:hypothetical protein